MQILINNEEVKNVLQGTISISRKTNGERSCSFSFFDVLPTVKDGDEIEVFEEDNKLFGGIIKSFSSRMMEPLTAEFPLIQVDVSSDGYDYIATRRVVSVSFTNTNVKAIVESMLSANNLGSDGVQVGTIESGPSINYTANFKTIKDVLDDMANASGYSWYIDDARQLQFGQMTFAPDSVFNLIEGGTFTDFSDLSWSGTMDGYANKVIVVGTNVAGNKQIDSEIAERQAEADGQSSGVYGYVIEDSNILSQFQAEQVADNHLRKSGIRPSSLSFSSYSFGWQPGTKMQVKIKQITGVTTIPFTQTNTWHYLIEEVQITRERGDITKYSISAVRRRNGNFTTQRAMNFVDYFKKLVK